MRKTWGEIRKDVMNLGFEPATGTDKDKDTFIRAYNWAQSLIASTIGGVFDRIGIGCSANHHHVFDLAHLAAGKDQEFIALAQSGVQDTKNNKIDGWSFTDNRFLTLPQGFSGHRVVNVLVMPAPFTASTPDTAPCPLPEKWRNILPYLMANRLYLEDDATKASYYWNLYTDMRNEILAQENLPQISVTGGFDIDRWCV